ncbi:hypothetical protein Trydic_g4627 [Trypoxylus dichotomus]
MCVADHATTRKPYRLYSFPENVRLGQQPRHRQPTVVAAASLQTRLKFAFATESIRTAAVTHRTDTGIPPPLAPPPHHARVDCARYYADRGVKATLVLSFNDYEGAKDAFS